MKENTRKIREKLEECVLEQLNKGIDAVETNELTLIIDMIKDLSEAEYHCTITETMKENVDE